MSKKTKLYVMDNGRNENDWECIVGMPFQLSDDNKTPRAKWVSVPVYSVLIEHEEGLLLFDSACHPDAMKSRWPESQKHFTPHFVEESQLLPNTLKRIGYTPDDVSYVVASHLHEDHAGCLEFFKRSEIFVHEIEFLNTLKLYATGEAVGGYIPKDIEMWLQAKLHWHLIPSDMQEFDVMDGVKIINLGSGHTFGMLGLLVSLQETGNILIVSDAINCSENFGPPVRLPGPIYDSIGFRKCVDKVRMLQKKYNAQVWFGHDAKQFSTLVKSDEGFYS